MSAPDSELARKAAALAAQAHSRPLLNHVHRTWWFAEFIGKKRQMKCDRELVYLASLLHDLGLSEDHAADTAAQTLALRNLSAFEMTDAELKLIASAAIIGESSSPVNG
ncbi:HD domain-containing protein [Burkholderia puraquae]